MDTGRSGAAESRRGHTVVRRRGGSTRRAVSTVGLPSTRLIDLLEGDLGGHRRETGDDGRVRFVPEGDGPTLEVASRVEERFLGRTEIAVFDAELASTMPEKSLIELRHTGGLKRTGLAARLLEGSEASRRVAEALASDKRLVDALTPLDFTRFEVCGDPTGSRARVELMGASHVAIALPPIRSYVHLYPDQREAMLTGLARLSRVIAASA